MTAARQIVLFTRSPEEEARAKGLPPEAASRLFWALLAGWRRAATDAGAHLLIVSPAGTVDRLARVLAGPATSVEAQSGDTFGDRIAEAAKRAFDRGASAVLLVAGDTPPPPRAVLEDAFSALASSRPSIVLGPAADGGVNLIGLSGPRPELLVGIVPGSSSIERTISDLARAARIEVIRLPQERDLDHLADIHRAYRASVAASAWRPYRILLKSILFVRPTPGDRVGVAVRFAPLSSLPSRSPPPPV